MIGPPLAEGLQAPEFAAYDQEGRMVRLDELRGRAVVLVFYIRDDTPG